ncbi:glycosyltransferase family 4 protein [Candidatus Albibeggiatoa sp. nov. NOAA]|uniref:MraY family glycosyltransferase n=1 Tax=Candidatus Albibeggiatoa sp. nov. NOAA TaxID=3162724 RepID=UPI00330493CB|nr:glycosyltransferase family 4 protein [Thiotrichaceae bacterium]
MSFGLLFFLSAFFLSWGLTAYLTRFAIQQHLMDAPNHRSLHTQPTPIIGGVAMLISLVLNVLLAGLWMPDLFVVITHQFWVPLLLIAGISYLDDRRSMSAGLRLLVHIIAAVWLLSDWQIWIQCISLPMFAIILPSFLKFFISVFFIVWMINLYNFMDGMDGFAGGMAVIGFGTLAVLGSLVGAHEFVLLNSLIVAVSLGFLMLNFPPAKVFMGDTGSSSLGYLAALMSLWGASWGLYPVWIAVLIFSPFIVDASVTLIRRFLNAEKIWQAHKTHYYQRLVQLGWGHRKTVLWQYGLMLACSASAIVAVFVTPFWQSMILISWCVIYVLLAWQVQKLEQANA